MRKSIQIPFAILIVVFCLSVSNYAQGTGATTVYRTQFIEMRGKVKSIFGRAEQQLRTSPTSKAKMNLREEILALTKLIHRLQEESLQTDGDAIAKGKESDKTLLLVSKGCIALDFVLSSLDDFIATDDRAFLSLARDGDDLIKSVEKTL